MSAAPDWRIRQIAVLTSLAVWLVYVTTTGGTMATGDAVAMFEAARSLVDHGRLDVPASQSSELWRGRDGRYYTPFGIGQSLFDVPFLLVGRAAADIVAVPLGDPDTIPKAFVAAASTIPAAITVGFTLLLAYRFASDARSSLLTALVLAFGTLLWPYAKFGFNAALTTAGLTAGLYGIAAGAADRRAWVLAAGGAGLATALLTRHEMMVAGLVVVVWLAWRVRGLASAGRLIVAGAAPVCVGLAVWMTLNAVRFGNPWHTGHEPAFSAEGFRAFLISPSGALLLYAPPAIAGILLVRLMRTGHALSRLLLSVSLALFVFYALLEDWLGTRSYGPRYLVPLLPLLVAPLAAWFNSARNRAQRTALAALCALGMAVQIPAIAVDFSRAGIESGQPPQAVRRDTWQWSPIVVNARATIPAAALTIRALASNTPLAAHRTGASLAERLPSGLDFWWMHLFHLGILPRAAAIASALLPLAVAAWLIRRALVETSSPGRRRSRLDVVG